MIISRHFLAAVSLFAFALPCFADETTWQVGTGIWSGSGNWSGDVVPSASIDALITNNGTSTVNSGTAQASKLTIGKADGETGTVVINSGATLEASGEVILGQAEQAQGSAVVNGMLSNTTTIHVGYNGSGSMNIGTGGSVWTDTYNVGSEGEHSSGVVSVSGSLVVTDLNVGFSGTGAMTIASGGVVGSMQGQIGRYSDHSPGTVTVEDGGYWSNSGLIYVGIYGSGTLNIEAGGLVRTPGIQLSYGDTTAPGVLVLSGVEGNRGTIITDEVASDGDGGKLIFDGGVLQADEHVTVLLDGFDHEGVVIEDGGAFIDTDTFHVEVRSTLSGSGALTLLGTGRLQLSGSSNYQGGTIVQSGTLQSLHEHGFVQDTAYTVNDGQLDLNGYNLTMSSLSGTGGQVLTGSATLTVDQTTSTIYSGTITSSDTLIKKGSGTLTLTGSSSVTATTIDEGVLTINGYYASDIVVEENGTMNGNGTHIGTVDIHGGISPGNSPGTLSTGNEKWHDGAFYIFEINDAEGTEGEFDGWDLIAITGDLKINEDSEADFVFTIYLTSLFGDDPGQAANFNPNSDYVWTLVSTTDGIEGFNLNEVVLNTDDFQNSYTGEFTLALTNGGNDLSVVYTVPEPSTYALLTCGGVVFVLVRRRSRLAP